MTQINNIDELKRFINECDSINAIESVLKHTLNVSLILYSNDEIDDIKQAIRVYLDKYSESEEMPLFVTTLELDFEHLKNIKTDTNEF